MNQRNQDQLRIIKHMYNEVLNRRDINPDRFQVEFKEIEDIIRFWENPNKCRDCKFYHQKNRSCPNTRYIRECNRCGSNEHLGTVCNNTTYISNRSYFCGCDYIEIKANRRKYQAIVGTHCCSCLRPYKITEMQISDKKILARCQYCREESERREDEQMRNKRTITPPPSPRPEKKERETYENHEEYDPYDPLIDMEIDPKEERSSIINVNEDLIYDQPESSKTSQKSKCTCWNYCSKFCEKHQHQPRIEDGKCLLCPKSSNVIQANQKAKENLKCSECNVYIDHFAMKTKCQAGENYCRKCYKDIQNKIEEDDEEMKRCPKHYQCIVFESKAAKKRFNDYDYEVQVQLLDKIFKEELKECTCSTCFKVGTLWLNGCETLCKNCDRVEKLERDEKNDKFYLKIARKVIEAKVEMKTADKKINISEAPITVQINTNEEKQKEEVIITNEEYNKMKELYEQKERELVYMREHYQKKLEEQEIIHKEIINIKDKRIEELNNTIAQQNISIENGNEYFNQLTTTNNQLKNLVEELYASIDQTNVGIDLLVNESQDSCTTSPIVGPIREHEYLVKNAQAL
jgi:hypothetical protein